MTIKTKLIFDNGNTLTFDDDVDKIKDITKEGIAWVKRFNTNKSTLTINSPEKKVIVNINKLRSVELIEVKK